MTDKYPDELLRVSTHRGLFSDNGSVAISLVINRNKEVNLKGRDPGAIKGTIRTTALGCSKDICVMLYGPIIEQIETAVGHLNSGRADKAKQVLNELDMDLAGVRLSKRLLARIEEML